MYIPNLFYPPYHVCSVATCWSSHHSHLIESLYKTVIYCAPLLPIDQVTSAPTLGTRRIVRNPERNPVKSITPVKSFPVKSCARRIVRCSERPRVPTQRQKITIRVWVVCERVGRRTCCQPISTNQPTLFDYSLLLVATIYFLELWIITTTN